MIKMFNSDAKNRNTENQKNERRNSNDSDLKCYRCAKCDGFGCPNMIPGLGGVMNGENFQLNVQGWQNLFEKSKNRNEAEKILNIPIYAKKIRCGPVTGATENIGYKNEKDFYHPYLFNAFKSGFGLCVGDGFPDEKLQFGLEAVKKISSENGNPDAAFFLKPYPQENLLKRVDLVSPYAKYVGVDIDSYNIATMRNLVNLEKKSAEQLIELKNRANKKFVLKGIFTEEDIELIEKVKPDVAYISNHGGRVETKKGSTADFLEKHAETLKKFCAEIWADGGIRTIRDIQTAAFYGADQIILARPLIRATFDDEYAQFVKNLNLKLK